MDSKEQTLYEIRDKIFLIQEAFCNWHYLKLIEVTTLNELDNILVIYRLTATVRG